MNEIRFELGELEAAAREFIRKMGKDKIWLFYGEMGAGKTTFIAEICRQLGAKDDFGSPTFSLVNEYTDLEGEPIYHFDLYRIESPAESMDMGAEEYFNSGSLCFVEWPDRLGALLPEDAVEVYIEENPDGSRSVKF